MREIKFRAWDKKIKKFGYVYLRPNSIHWPSVDWFKQRNIIEKVFLSVYICGVGFDDIEGWQQYTGLKDKNGKEIYEGDIVKFGLNNIRVVKIPDIFLWESGPDAEFVCCIVKGAFEIIGNIYENPELL